MVARTRYIRLAHGRVSLHPRRERRRSYRERRSNRGNGKRPVPGKPSAAAAASVGLPSEGRGEAARPRRRVPPVEPQPLIAGQPGCFSPLRWCAPDPQPRPGRQAWRAEGVPLKKALVEKVVTSRRARARALLSKGTDPPVHVS